MIGLFDSGSGGLTILESCRQALPEEDFVYLGDHANAPYGHRSNQEILQFTKAGVEALFKQGCSLVILACNTAAAVALRSLQQNWLHDAWPGRNILGVLVPMVEEVSGVPWHEENPTDKSAGDTRNIALFATSKTVDSGAYKEELAKRAPQLILWQKACPGLVEAIETGASQEHISGLVNGYMTALLSDMMGVLPDAIVLGCTHFPLVRSCFEDAIGDDTPIYCQPSIVAKSLEKYVATHFIYKEREKGEQGSVELFTTGDPKTLQTLQNYLPKNYAAFRKLP